MAKKNIYDVIVVGGGIAGLLQSILLAQNGITVLCLDKQNPNNVKKSPLYQRTTAISYGSHQLLKASHLWDQVKPYACPIQKIDVYDNNSPLLLDFDIHENTDAEQAQAFGWVIENHYIIDTLTTAIRKLKNITYITDIDATDLHQNNQTITITCNNNTYYEAALLIGADGRQSFIRKACNIESEEFDYNQRAIVSIITHETPHNGQAVEHFKSSGPFAILPMLDDENNQPRSSIVWTENNRTKNSIMNFSDQTYLTALKEQFPSEYGQIISTTNRFSYPLGFVHAHRYIDDRVALIGDAAHGIHPVAGQGLNLGLRDVACLSELLLQQKSLNADLGADDLLHEYESKRKTDNTIMAFSMDTIDRIFSNQKPVTRTVRKIGLRLIDKIKPAKAMIISNTMGTAGGIPKIIKEGKI